MLVRLRVLGSLSAAWAAEGGDLDRLRRRTCTCTSRKRRPMMRERRNSARTSSGVALGGDVEVLGLASEQQVAHRAADDEGGVALLLQRGRTLRAQGLMRLRATPCFSNGMTSGSCARERRENTRCRNLRIMNSLGGTAAEGAEAASAPLRQGLYIGRRTRPACHRRSGLMHASSEQETGASCASSPGAGPQADDGPAPLPGMRVAASRPGPRPPGG